MLIPLNVKNLVLSKSGHDSGRIYLITQVIDEDFVLAVDGDKRRIANPKRKRQKHLKFLANANIKDNYLDEDIRAIIKDWRNNAQRG